MKKIVSIICILILLIATSHLAVNIHFCGNKISSIVFFGKKKTCGGTCDSKTTIKQKSCCKNFAATITTDDSTTSFFSFKTEHKTIALVPVLLSIVTTVAPSRTEILKHSVACNAPPNISEQPFYILYRSLII